MEQCIGEGWFEGQRFEDCTEHVGGRVAATQPRPRTPYRYSCHQEGGQSHSDFFDILEEKLELIEFEKLTLDSLVTHIFLQEADTTLTKVASDILYDTDGKGDIVRLRNEIKLVEASQWQETPGEKGRRCWWQMV